MKLSRMYWIVGLAVATVGCSKSETPPAATVGGSAAGAKPAAAAAAAPAAVAPDVYMQGVVDAFAAGNTGALWNALPTKYQSDVTSLKNEFAGKMDGEVWNKSFAVIGKLSGVLKSKKDFILKSQMTAGAPPEVKATFEKSWDDVVGMLNTLANSEIKTIDGLKAADPGRFLNATGGAVVGGIMKTAESTNPEAKAGIDKLRKAKVSLVKQDGDTATLKLEAPGEPAEEKVFKKVDGKWLPDDMVAGWDKNIADAKTDLSTMTIPPEQKGLVLQTIGQVDTLLDKLAAANDQAAFDAELGGAMMQFLPLLGALSGGGGGAMSGPPGAMSGPPPGAAPPSTLPSGAGIPAGPGGIPAGVPSLPATTTPPAGSTPATITPPATTTPAAPK
jgi:hypothetical protein